MREGQVRDVDLVGVTSDPVQPTEDPGQAGGAVLLGDPHDQHGGAGCDAQGAAVGSVATGPPATTSAMKVPWPKPSV